MAQGFEIVQSVFPGWKFAPADTVIVNGLHGALLLAPRHPAGFGSAGLLARDPVNSPLAPGDIVTTGTLTRAFPILPGESWSTTLRGIGLGGRPVWFA